MKYFRKNMKKKLAILFQSILTFLSVVYLKIGPSFLALFAYLSRVMKLFETFGPDYEITVLIAYSNMHAQLSSGVIGLILLSEPSSTSILCVCKQ